MKNVFYLSVLFVLFSCNNDFENELLKEKKADVVVENFSLISDTPNFIKDRFPDSFVKEISKIDFIVDGENIPCIALTVNSTNENETTTIIYDEEKEIPRVITQVVELENGKQQINYFSTIESKLLFQLEGEHGEFGYTYLASNDSNSNSNERTLGWGSSWYGCVQTVTDDNYFYITVGYAFLSGGLSLGGVAAGVVIGCAGWATMSSYEAYRNSIGATCIMLYLPEDYSDRNAIPPRGRFQGNAESAFTNELNRIVSVTTPSQDLPNRIVKF